MAHQNEPGRFYPVWRQIHEGGAERALAHIDAATPLSVSEALTKRPVDPTGFFALLSEAATSLEKQVEESARELTEQRFGRVVNLYIPLYLTNSCVNDCLYCGFGRSQDITRSTLTLDEVRLEGMRIKTEGYRSVLLVAGEDRKAAPVSYIAEAIELLKNIGFVFVGLEAGPLSVEEYTHLGAVGLDSVTVYQETYHFPTYERCHPTGPKKDFAYRLATPERVAEAGIRSVNIGFLLGLYDFRYEAVAAATHMKFLQKHFWQTSVGVSFPRIHSAPGGFTPGHPVSDQELVRLIMAMRLYHPDAILTLSTRERASLRDRLFGAGINQVSAGSKTSPGAYAVTDAPSGEQFPVVDDRTPAEVMEAIRRQGYEWVFKDWDPVLKPVSRG